MVGIDSITNRTIVAKRGCFILSNFDGTLSIILKALIPALRSSIIVVGMQDEYLEKWLGPTLIPTRRLLPNATLSY